MSARLGDAGSLARLQELFWRAVRTDPGPREIDEIFRSRGALAARDRAAIYRRMYWYRQVDALFDTFPRTARALGAERFTALACRYIDRHPSEAPALERLGRCFDAFLLDAGEAVAVASLATLERLHLEAFLAPDPASVARLADVDAETFATSSLAFVASFVHGRVTEGGLDLHARIDDDTALVAHASPDARVDAGAPRVVAAVRRGFAVGHVTLADDEAEALSTARSGAPLSDVCATFGLMAGSERRAFEVLRTWFDRGWIETISKKDI